jgi:hypothetical protein
MERAIRAFGLKSNYSMEELHKPFVTARLMFTGRSADPELRRIFAKQIAQNALDSGRMLFAPSASMPRPPALPPPAIDATPSADDEDDLPASWSQAPSREQSAPQTQTQPTQQPAPQTQTQPTQQPAAQHPAQGGAHPGRDLVLKFSRSKGKTVGQAETNDLEWIRDTVSSNLEAGESRFPDSDKKLLDAVNAELATRGGY